MMNCLFGFAATVFIWWSWTPSQRNHLPYSLSHRMRCVCTLSLPCNLASLWVCRDTDAILGYLLKPFTFQLSCNSIYQSSGKCQSRQRRQGSQGSQSCLLMAAKRQQRRHKTTVNLTPPTPPSRSLDNFHEPLPLSIIIDLIDASTAAAAALFQSWLVHLRFFDAAFFSLWCFSSSLSLSPWLCLSLTVSVSLSLYI